MNLNTEETLLTQNAEYQHYDAILPDEEAEKVAITSISELKRISISSIPLVLTFTLQYFLSITSMYAAGRLGAKELAACSLALCTFNITGLAVYQGMASSLDTFCSQAFGSGNIKMVGVYFQRCSVIILTISIPLVVLWFNSGAILKTMVPDTELAEMAETFLKIHAIGAPGLILFETGKRFLTAQNIFNAGSYILVMIIPINLILNWLLVWHPTYGLGYNGIALAIVITYWLIDFFMLAYVVFIDGKQCWGGFDLRKAFTNWKPMLSLAIPGVIMVIAEFLAFEVLTILAARFGTESLAAQSIASNVASLAFQLPFAIAVALSTNIGNYVGQKNVAAAKCNSNLFAILASCTGTINFAIMFFGRHTIGKLFTNDEKVLTITTTLLILTAINQFGDSLVVIGSGVLRGQGRQRIGSILNMISYYLVALPVGFYLAFNCHLDLNGLWLGLITGVAFLSISTFIAVYLSNWPQIIEKSHGMHDSI